MCYRDKNQAKRSLVEIPWENPRDYSTDDGLKRVRCFFVFQALRFFHSHDQSLARVYRNHSQ